MDKTTKLKENTKCNHYWRYLGLWEDEVETVDPVRKRSKTIKSIVERWSCLKCGAFRNDYWADNSSRIENRDGSITTINTSDLRKINKEDIIKEERI